MSDKITITLVNERELRARFGEIVRKLEQPGELLDRIGGLLEQNIQFRFDTKTAPDGTPWLPLSPNTVARYQAQVKKSGKLSRRTRGADGKLSEASVGAGAEGSIPGSLLERTRHMRDSLTHNVGDGFVEVGFGDVIAMYHEFGTRRGLPRRQLLTDDPVAGTLAESDREEILAEIEAYLQAL